MAATPADPKELEAIELFYFAYRSFTALPDRVLKEYGLGRVHHRILYFVGRNPGVNINELLQILAVSKQALNAPLRRLMELNLILVKLARHDRRVKQLILSKDGESLERQLTLSQIEHLQTAFEHCGTEATAAWAKVMREIPLV